MRHTFSPNEELQSLILELRKIGTQEKVNLWKRVAEDLSKPSRQRRVVNLSRISLHTKDNDTIIVPGKVLSDGEIHHKVQVAAFGFSKTAVDKINEAKGKIMTIQELVKTNPKAKGIRLIG